MNCFAYGIPERGYILHPVSDSSPVFAVNILHFVQSLNFFDLVQPGCTLFKLLSGWFLTEFFPPRSDCSSRSPSTRIHLPLIIYRSRHVLRTGGARYSGCHLAFRNNSVLLLSYLTFTCCHNKLYLKDIFFGNLMKWLTSTVQLFVEVSSFIFERPIG